MPINSAQLWVQSLINGLPMPGGALDLVAVITPPAPDVNPDAAPHAYIWPSSGNESRNPQRGGTVPRAAYPGAGSGNKPIEHTLNIYVIWAQPNDEEQADSWFPGMLDTIMATLRTSQDPVIVTDPWSGQKSWMIDVGENMNYQTTVRALEDQRLYRYDGLITCHLLELIAA